MRQHRAKEASLGQVQRHTFIEVVLLGRPVQKPRVIGKIYTKHGVVPGDKSGQIGQRPIEPEA